MKLLNGFFASIALLSFNPSDCCADVTFNDIQSFVGTVGAQEQVLGRGVAPDVLEKERNAVKSRQQLDQFNGVQTVLKNLSFTTDTVSLNITF